MKIMSDISLFRNNSAPILHFPLVYFAFFTGKKPHTFIFFIIFAKVDSKLTLETQCTYTIYITKVKQL